MRRVSQSTSYLFMALALITLAATLGLVASRDARADHHRWAITHPDYNPSGTYTWAVRAWVVGNGGLPGTSQQVSWCNNLGSYSTEVSQVFSEWEAVLSGTQYHGCGSRHLDWLRRREGHHLR